MKDGIGVSCLRSAVNKTCPHRMKESVTRQVGRIKSVGFPDHVVTRACEKVIREIKSATGRAGQEVPVEKEKKFRSRAIYSRAVAWTKKRSW